MLIFTKCYVCNYKWIKEKEKKYWGQSFDSTKADIHSNVMIANIKLQKRKRRKNKDKSSIIFIKMLWFQQRKKETLMIIYDSI